MKHYFYLFISVAIFSSFLDSMELSLNNDWLKSGSQPKRTIIEDKYNSTAVNVVQISKDYVLLLNCLFYNSSQLCSAENGKLIQTLLSEVKDIKCIMLSNEDIFAAVSNSHNLIKLISLKSATKTPPFIASSLINVMAISLNGKFIVFGSKGARAMVFKIRNEPEGFSSCNLIGHSDVINSVAISFDNNCIVTGSDDMTAKIWGTDGKPLHTLIGHNDSVCSLAISFNNKFVVTGSNDKNCIIWLLATGELIHTLYSDSQITAVAISSDCKIIITASRDGKVKVWDAESFLLKHTLDAQSVINVLSISSDNKCIATASINKTVIVWELLTTLFGAFQEKQQTLYAHLFSKDGKQKLIHFSYL